MDGWIDCFVILAAIASVAWGRPCSSGVPWAGETSMSTCGGTSRLPSTAVDSSDLTSFGSVVAISHLCSLCGAHAITHITGPGLPAGMLPEVAPSDQGFRSWSATCIKHLWIRQKWLQPDLSCSLCYLLSASDLPTPEVLSSPCTLL